MKATVTITGSNGSLGIALASKFFKNDYPLILHSRVRQKSILRFKNKTNRFIYGDLQNISIINKIVNEIKKNKNNIIINNAGIYLKKNFDEVNFKEIDKIININLLSNIKLLNNLTKLQNNKFLIININSVAGLSGSPGESLYSASKHALKGFYDSLESEPSNKFDILNIYPGAFKSKITKKRSDFNNLMDVNEISEAIYKNIVSYNSIKLNNIFLKRKIY